MVKIPGELRRNIVPVLAPPRLAPAAARRFRQVADHSAIGYIVELKHRPQVRHRHANHAGFDPDQLRQGPLKALDRLALSQPGRVTGLPQRHP
jgi:hypothetical protein